jgi:hypothetical protein
MKIIKLCKILVIVKSNCNFKCKFAVCSVRDFGLKVYEKGTVL